MKQLTLSLLSLSLLIACNNNVSDTTSDNPDSAVAKPAAPLNPATISGCYARTSGRDTVTILLTTNGTSITGPLVYKLFEKDRNDGTFSGEVVNGLLRGWYLFRSEGVMSVREVIFKNDNNQLIPGTGDVEMRGDSVIFKNAEKLQFDTSQALKKVDCVL